MSDIRTDREILALYAARDERAVSETARVYGGLCRQIARNILGNEQDAEECVNDALMQAWRGIPPEPDRLPAYLAAITRNLALNRCDLKRAQKRGGGQLPAALDELSEMIAAPVSVEEQTDARALSEAIEQFLRGQPAKHRRVFLRRYFSMLSIAEIAEDLHMNENTVKSSLKRTRDRLRAYLQKEGYL